MTAADRAVEELIRTPAADGPARTTPSSARRATTTRARVASRWVVDPIDGTVNYLYGSRQYAVSIAAEVDGQMVAGVVHRPPTGTVRRHPRRRVRPATAYPLRVRDAVPLEQRLVRTGFSYVPEVRGDQAAAIAALLPRVRDIRRPGSCALDLCAVAAGEADGYVEEGPTSGTTPPAG